MKMIILRFCIILFLSMLKKIESNDQSSFVIDYFAFKNVAYVVGFFCCTVEEKLLLSKKLHKFGIRTSFPNLDVDSQIFWLTGSRYSKIGVFVDISCFNENKLRSLLSKASDWRLYDEIHSWVIFSGGNSSQVLNQLDESAFGMSTDLVVVLTITNSYELFDVYNPWKGGGGKMNVTHFGCWNRSTGLNITLTQSKFNRRCNLYGLSMKSYFFRSNYRPKNVSVEDYMKDDSTLYKDGLSKFGYNLVTHLSEMFNFTVKFGEIKKWLHGDTLGPMSRALVQNEIQITGSPIIITEERLNVTKFVYPAWPFRTCFIFRNPQRKDMKVGEVLHPFTDKCWYATLFAMVTIFSALALSFAQESYMIVDGVLSNTFTTVIGSICQQGTNLIIERISTRIIFFHLMILSFLTYNYYNAVVVSIRLNEPTIKISDSLSEFGKLGFKMASEPMNYFEFIFSRLSARERKVFFEDRWLKIPESERFMFPEKAGDLVRQGGFAYHTHPDVIYPIIHRTFSYRQICELMEVHPIMPRFSTLSVQYNSTFVEMAKIGLSRMTEVGIRKRQILRWTSRKPICVRDKMNIESTDIYEFAPHLMLLAIGSVVTATVFIFEFIYDCYRNYQSKHSMYP